MECYSALSTKKHAEDAAEEVCERFDDQFDTSPDLSMLFVSPHHIEELQYLVDEIGSVVDETSLIGTMGSKIVGTGREIEQEPAVCLWATTLPDANIRLAKVDYESTPEGGAFTGWPKDLPFPWPSDTTLFTFGDPFTFPVNELLDRINEDHEGVSVMGGMASGGESPGENRLICRDEVFTDGAVVAHLTDVNSRITSVVSQGCKPIGDPFVVTKSRENAIFELGGEPAVVQLKHVFEDLPEETRQIARRGLHMGVVMDERQDSFQHGDFLIRNVLGIDQEHGALAIGGMVQTGQTVQFQVRAAESADENLRSQLQQVHEQAEQPIQGGLLFTCNGRGTHMFDESHHDARAIQDVFGNIPVGGYFCQGEIGPVAGKNFLHGFTASLALFS